MKLFNTYKFYFSMLCVFSPSLISSSLKAENSNPYFAGLRQSFSTAQLVSSDQSYQGEWYCRHISHNGGVTVLKDRYEISIYGRVLRMSTKDSILLFEGIKSSKGLRMLYGDSTVKFIQNLRVDSTTGNLIVEYNIEKQVSEDSTHLPESIAEPGFFADSYTQCLKAPE